MNIIQRNTCCSCFGVDIFPNVSFMSKPHFIFANVKFRSDVAECEKSFATRTKRGKTRVSRFLGSHGNHPCFQYSHENPYFYTENMPKNKSSAQIHLVLNLNPLFPSEFPSMLLQFKAPGKRVLLCATFF